MLSKKKCIEVRNLSKCFQVYSKPSDRLKQFLLPKIPFIGRGNSCFYKEFWALRNISIDINEGEVVGIIGQNGAGKSTLLQIICGTLQQTTGEVVKRGRISALLELGSGFNPEYSGRENVYLNASILGLSKNEIDAKINDIEKFADIGKFIDQPVKSYSSGMYVRLAFSVAIHVDPRILIVDEALAVGDIKFQTKCLRAIDALKQSGTSIIFVTHSSGQIEALCDRVFWLHKGEMLVSGEPSQVMRHYINFMVHGIEPDLSQNEKVEEESCSAENDCWTTITESNNTKGLDPFAIRKVAFLHEDLSPIHKVTSSVNKVVVKLEIETEEDIFNPIIAIGIFNSLNEPVIHFNSLNTELNLKSLPKNHSNVIELSFSMPGLRPGEYLLSVGIDSYENGVNTIVSHVYDAWDFYVTPQGKISQGGYFQIELGTVLVTQ
jgi:lipopolysaccharide transport system ATP-binding protein